MKKVVLFFFLFNCFICFSQANRDDVRVLLTINGSEIRHDIQMVPYLEYISDNKKKSFKRDLKRYQQKFVKEEVDFYSQEFSQDEILKLIKFYNSPLGKKYIEKTKEHIHKTLHNQKQQHQDLQGILMKYMN